MARRARSEDGEGGEGDHAEGAERERVGREQRLRPQRLPDQQQHDPEVADRDRPHDPRAHGLDDRAVRQERRQQRQHLEGVQADEVGDAQVAARRAPADEEQPGAAVGHADGVAAVRREQEPDRHPDQRHQEAESDRERHRPVPTGLAQEPQCDGEREEPDHGDGGTHDREERAAEEVIGVVVRLLAASGLADDDHHLEHEARDDRPAGAAQRTLPQLAEHPGQREREQRDRDRELQRLEPERGADQRALVDKGEPGRHQGEGRHARGEPVETGVAAASVGEQCAHRLP